MRDFTEWWCRQHTTAKCDPPDAIVNFDVSIRGAAGLLTFVVSAVGPRFLGSRRQLAGGIRQRHFRLHRHPQIWWPSHQFQGSEDTEESRISGPGPGPRLESGSGSGPAAVWGLGDLRDRLVEWCGCGHWWACWNEDQRSGASDSPLHANNGLHKGLLDDHSTHSVDKALAQGAPSAQDPQADASGAGAVGDTERTPALGLLESF